MTEKDKNRIIIVGFIITIIVLLIQLMRDWPGFKDFFDYVENGSFFGGPPALNTSEISGGGNIFNFPGLGSVFDGPLKGENCGCQTFICPQKQEEFSFFVPELENPTFNIVPLSSYEYAPPVKSPTTQNIFSPVKTSAGLNKGTWGAFDPRTLKAY